MTRRIFVATVWLLLAAFAVSGCSSPASPESAPAATATAPPVPTAAAQARPQATSTASAHTPAPPIATSFAADLAPRLADEAMGFLREFTAKVSPRASATQQERSAAEYLLRQFEALGYRAQLQPFAVEVVETEVTVSPQGTREVREIESLHISLSGTGRAAGPLAHAGKALEADLPPAGLAGKIALIQRGDITFEEKVARVAAAGAAAAVVYNNRPGLFGGTLRGQATIPAIAISLEDGESIRGLMAAGEVQVVVSVAVEARDTQNVIAEKPGTSGDNKQVVLGGHYDTVPDVPGANDNGSGIASLVAIAKEVSNRRYPFTLRFIAFGAEELGLRGSRFYVESLGPQARDVTIAMLNFDALGTGAVVGALGDPELVSRVVALGRDNGIAVKRRFGLDGTSSDHASFQQAGIPVVFFVADDISRIHTPEDRVESVQPELMGNSAALAIALLDSLAQP